MIPKPINEISREDFQSLIDGEVIENKTLEYKREIPAGGIWVAFLAAISASARSHASWRSPSAPWIRRSPMSIDTPRYFVTSPGAKGPRHHWQPSTKLRAKGFTSERRN